MNLLDLWLLFQATTVDSGVGPAKLANFWPAVSQAAWFLGGALVTAALGWYVVEPAISRMVRRRNENNETLQEAITRYLRLVVVIIAVFVGAGVAGYGQFLNNSALVIAAGTLALGVAGQTVIGSMVSGVALVSDPEFNVGNYIEWADGEGVVKSITLRVTRIHTPNGKLVTVPNTKLTEDDIARPYGRKRLRVVERVGLAYDDDVDTALEHLTAAAETIDGVRADPAPKSYIEEFGSDAVILRAHYWIDHPRRRNVLGIRSRYAKALKERLEGDDITISPPSKRELEGRLTVDETSAEAL